MSTGRSVAVLGSTGAVGSEAVRALLTMPEISSLTLLGRRPLEGLNESKVVQHRVDIFDPASYRDHLTGHQAVICTLGVGQPSKMGKDEFVRIDRDACLEFGRCCREAGVQHFELLGSVGADSTSRSFYLRAKGELEDGLRALGFARLSLFRPSMILTPTNRYGVSQGIALAVWPKIQPLLIGRLRKYRGIHVQRLGTAIARNLLTAGHGAETLHWDAIDALAKPST